MGKRSSADRHPPAAIRRESGEPSPADQLPTLQRNALCKIFSRSAFTPEEVAQLGSRRIRLAESIGEKGMKTIGEWLARHGYQLLPENARARQTRPDGDKHIRGLERAMRLLRNHGYEISQPRSAPESARITATAKVLGKDRQS